MANDDGWVRIEKEFAAPMDQVWAMWTDGALFKSWYGPNGMSVPVAELDLKIGGIRKVSMEMVTPERTMTMWFTGVFKEIEAPRRLVYTESMCNADGVIISPADMGMPPGTPDVTEVIVELTATDEGTHMVMVHRGVPEGSAGAGGWAQAFDKLAKMLT